MTSSHTRSGVTIWFFVWKTKQFCSEKNAKAQLKSVPTALWQEHGPQKNKQTNKKQLRQVALPPPVLPPKSTDQALPSISAKLASPATTETKPKLEKQKWFAKWKPAVNSYWNKSELIWKRYAVSVTKNEQSRIGSSVSQTSKWKQKEFQPALFSLDEIWDCYHFQKFI